MVQRSPIQNLTDPIPVPFCGFNTLKEFDSISKGHKLEGQKKGGAYKGWVKNRYKSWFC